MENKCREKGSRRERATFKKHPKFNVFFPFRGSTSVNQQAVASFPNKGLHPIKLHHSRPFWLLFPGGSPTYFGLGRGSNYPSLSCNGPNGQKGSKFKQTNKQTIKLPRKIFIVATLLNFIQSLVSKFLVCNCPHKSWALIFSTDDKMN